MGCAMSQSVFMQYVSIKYDVYSWYLHNNLMLSVVYLCSDKIYLYI